MALHLALGLAIAGAIAVVASRLHALTPGGAWAAVVVGALVFGGGGARWGAILVLFFASSSALSRLPRAAMGYAQKEGPRDAWQVVANGAMPAIAGAVALLLPSGRPDVLFAASVAAATADTWASEIGMSIGGEPRHVLTGRRVRPGTSGGITLGGTLGATVGSLVIAGAAVALLAIGPAQALVVVLWGLGGCLIDSVLGATLQEVRYCPVCQRMTEQRTHAICGSATRYARGAEGFDNDRVNLLSSALAGIGAAVTALVLL